jgi:hypothetical protein
MVGTIAQHAAMQGTSEESVVYPDLCRSAVVPESMAQETEKRRTDQARRETYLRGHYHASRIAGMPRAA